MDITSDKDQEQQDPLKLKIDAYVIQQLNSCS